MPALRVKLYRGFPRDRAGLSPEAQARLNTFFRLVSFDPDDASIIQLCQAHRPYSIRWGGLAYPLGEGFVVYWRVLRERNGIRDFLSIKPLKPIEIVLLGIHRFPADKPA